MRERLTLYSCRWRRLLQHTVLPQRPARTIRRLATVLLAVAGLQAFAQESSNCQELFTKSDPRLFEFLKTRDLVNFEQYEGFLITNIEYVVLPIFNEEDPQENNWLYRSANFLHIDSREKLLKKQLTLVQDQPLQKRAVEENERLLRANNYLADAMILPQQVCGHQITLLVVVRDIWSLSPSASVGRSGGENKTDFGITEKNLLGLGQELSLGWFKNEDRSGIGLSYRNQQLFNNHSNLAISYSENSDGEIKTINLARPFYALNTPWSAGVDLHDERLTEEIESQNLTINTYEHEIWKSNVYYGWSPGLKNGLLHRWKAGIADNEERYTAVLPNTPAPPADKQLTYPWLSFESLEAHYWTTANITQIHRHEDILLGTRWQALAGYATKNAGSSENAVIFELSGSYTSSFGEHHLLQLIASSDGRLNTDTDSLVSSFASLGATYHFFISPKDRWYARLQLDAGKHLNPDELLEISGSENLRGYPSDFQRGTRRWLFTLERRHFSNWHLFRLLRFGGALYLDAGRCWDTETHQSPATDTLANIGMGLRVSSSKARTDKVLHIDIASPLLQRGDIDSYQLIVSGKAMF